MLRRLAISLAATSAMVLTATAPALADHKAEHDDPLPFHTFEGENLKTCKGDVIDLLAESEHTDVEVFWEKPKDVGSKDDITDHNWWDMEISDDLEWLTLTKDGGLPDGDFLVALVKGGNATNMFVIPTLDREWVLYAPINPSGGHAQISNHTICKFRGDVPPPPEKETPPDDGDEPKEEDSPEPKAPESPEPKTTETPAAVPTAVPAGMSGSDGGSMAPIGLAAAALMMVAGGAALLRRRFAHQN